MAAVDIDPARAQPGALWRPVVALRAIGRADPRTRRVVLLIVAIMIMSVGDLLLTLTYLRHLGMAESNPLARLVLDFNSPTLLIVWKMATVLACTSILLWKSRSISAEVGAWLGTSILAALMLHWSTYVKTAPPLPAIETASLFQNDERWMTLAPADPSGPARASVPTP